MMGGEEQVSCSPASLTHHEATALFLCELFTLAALYLHLLDFLCSGETQPRTQPPTQPHAQPD